VEASWDLIPEFSVASGDETGCGWGGWVSSHSKLLRAYNRPVESANRREERANEGDHISVRGELATVQSQVLDYRARYPNERRAGESWAIRDVWCVEVSD
jgi:hypothetical protein